MATSPLRYLGVAFGTKFIYFCSRAFADRHGGHTAPVLDSVVRQWLAAHARTQLSVSSWKIADYRRYITILTNWGSELDLPMDRVEELIFRHQITRNGSALWSESEILADPVGQDALDALAQLEIALGELGFDAADNGQPRCPA